MMMLTSPVSGHYHFNDLEMRADLKLPEREEILKPFVYYVYYYH